MNTKRGYYYYPGCSLKGTAKGYEESLLAVFKYLDINVEELPDWNCCGATSYMSVDAMAAFTMTARNLAIAEQNNKDIIAPCSACYMALKKTQNHMLEYPEIREKIEKALKSVGLSYKGKVNVHHPLNVIVDEVGEKEIRLKTQKKLSGLRVFCYYACLILRPYSDLHPRNPMILDKVMAALGATAVDHPLKGKCCGGALMGTVEEIGLRMSYLILREAKKKGCQVVSTVCPLCQFNLDAYQPKMEKRFKVKLSLPVLYFSQIMGVAFGIAENKLGLTRNLVYPDILFTKAAL